MKTILVDARNTFVTEKGINKDIQNFLDSLPNKKIIVTNANDEQLITFGIVNMPYEVFTLKHNPNKVDPKYFETLMELFALDPDEIIYFEHNSEAVQSAQSLGITTHHYDKDMEKLKIFLEGNM
ncbi:MAG: HAD-IA family hydrolase [Candidatus Absconditabacteria bacterium]